MTTAELEFAGSEPAAAAAATLSQSPVLAPLDGQQGQAQLVKVRIRNISGELVTQPTLPGYLTVRQLRHWLAERDSAGTPAGRLRLLLEGDRGAAPDRCSLAELAASEGDAAAQTRQPSVELQLVRGNGLRVMSDEDFMKFLDASDSDGELVPI